MPIFNDVLRYITIFEWCCVYLQYLRAGKPIPYIEISSRPIWFACTLFSFLWFWFVWFFVILPTMLVWYLTWRGRTHSARLALPDHQGDDLYLALVKFVREDGSIAGFGIHTSTERK